MSSSLLTNLNLETLTASRLWPQLSRETRTEAARALYTREEGAEAIDFAAADLAIARAIRFRDKTVRSLPIEKKVSYMAASVRPEEPLATILLQALHLKLRRPLLTTFLDNLGIQHEGGNIKDDEDLSKKTEQEIDAAAAKLYATFPEDQVDVYLASLLAFEAGNWVDLRTVLAKRANPQQS